MMAKRRVVLLAVLALVVAGIAALLFWTSRPPQFASLVMATLGRSLGLEITAGGASEYHLRGTPVLVVRDVVVREPGAGHPAAARRPHPRLGPVVHRPQPWPVAVDPPH
jgi:hypothetical protein